MLSALLALALLPAAPLPLPRLEPIPVPVEVADASEITLTDLMRFPNAAATESAAALASAHVHWLEANRDFYAPDLERHAWERQQWQFLVDEASKLRDIWLTLENAHSVGINDPDGENGDCGENWWGSDAQHIASLEYLRCLLGEADWLGGRMSAPVPIHRFREVR